MNSTTWQRSGHVTQHQPSADAQELQGRSSTAVPGKNTPEREFFCLTVFQTHMQDGEHDVHDQRWGNALKQQCE